MSGTLKKKPLVLFIVGPTAGGKTAVAVELAKRLNAEIISADSMQVYRGLDILSAKPSAKERRAIKHHLIDILDPEQEYSAAMFCEKAGRLIREIIGRQKTALISGGTGMYVRSLVHGIFADKGRNEKLRQQLYTQAEEKGNEFVYKQLEAEDPQAAESIHPNNLKRVVRALEACRVNRKRFSELKQEVRPLTDDYTIRMFGLDRPRRELYSRIEQRVDEMFRQGVVAEVARIEKYKLSATIKQAIGIKPISDSISGKMTEEEAAEIIKRDTRRFAKRQLTWFRNQEKDIVWVDVSAEEPAGDVAARIMTFL